MSTFMNFMEVIEKMSLSQKSRSVMMVMMMVMVAVLLQKNVCEVAAAW